MDIDRSLDDIIKQNKNSQVKAEHHGAYSGRARKVWGRGRGKGGGRGGGILANGRNGAFQNGDNFRKLTNGVKNKPVGKAVRKLESVSTGRKHKAVAPMQGQGSGTLQVSNLHFNVSDSDVKDLFGEIGKIKKSNLHYDQSGRSLGTADVTYERRSDAIKAMKQYNGVPLDGKPMKIEVAAAFGQSNLDGQIRTHIGVKQSGIKFNYKNVANGGTVVKKNGKVVGREGKVLGRGNVRGGGKARDGRKLSSGGKLQGEKFSGGGKVKARVPKGPKKKAPKDVKKIPTAEELDKEIDDYQNGRS